MPAAPATHQWEVNHFRGADLTNVSSGVDGARAVACPNMIRESVGKVRKRTGFYQIHNLKGRINGVYTFTDSMGTRQIIHAGTNLHVLFDGNITLAGTDMADARSQAQQLGKWLCILDGMHVWLYGKNEPESSEGGGGLIPINESGAAAIADEEYSLKEARERAYVPTILIARAPTGGGTPYEPINMLTPRREEHFLGVASKTVYKLSATNLDTADTVTDTGLVIIAKGNVKVKKMKNDTGEMAELTEGTDYTVDYEKGKVTFKTAPGASPVLGKDNIYITYSKTVIGHYDRIAQCRFCTLYGVNGARDRLFVSGSPEYPYRDYYSQFNNPSYFGDTWYSEIGSGDSRIVGYSIIGDQLATHLQGARDGTNVILRRGQLSEVSTTQGTTTVLSSTQSSSSSTSTTGPGSTASFRVTGSLQCDSAASPYAFATLETEPLFVTKNDILAVTPFDYSGERYAQSRAYYLRGLLKTLDLTDCCAVAWNGFYVLAAGEYLFFLDGSQASFEKNAPYSTRQYEAYYWTGINARVLFIDSDGALCFGTGNGKIYKFHADYFDVSNFHDEINGEKRAIHAYWQTPEIYGDNFYYRKDFRRIAILLGAAARTGCRIWGIYQGEKELLRDYDGTARYFSYEKFCYSKHSYKTDRTPQKLLEKIKVKKADSVSFLVENNQVDEPLMLYALAAEYTQRL